MRKLLFTLMILYACVFISEDVHAEENKEYTYSITGYVKSNQFNYYETDTYNVEFSSGVPLCAYTSVTDYGDRTQVVLYIVRMESNGSFYEDSFFSSFGLKKNNSFNVVYSDAARTTKYSEDTLKRILYQHSQTQYVRTFEEYEVIITMPVFANKAEAQSYLKGELTEKDALNYESDLCKIVYDLETPQNMKAVQDEGLFSGAMKFTWTQSAEGYEEWETEFYVFEDFKYRSSFLTLSLADWKYAENFYLFTEYVDTRKLYFRITEEIFEKHEVQKKRSDAYPCDYGGYYDPLVDTYYIRNHYFDGELHHYSNWVVVTFDYESGDIVTNIKEVSGSEIEVDDSGNVVVGESEKVQDSQYDDDYDVYSKESSSDIVNFIKSGFGLLGEDGVLTLLSQTFSFIPSELWSVFIAGMALMVIIAVAKFVRG